MPWSGPGGVGGGKLTVIKAGPGFHEEKSYDIGADGHFSEVKPVSMMHDGRKCCYSFNIQGIFWSENETICSKPRQPHGLTL